MVIEPYSRLGSMAVSEFLDDVWQQRPIFLPNAVGTLPSLDADTLAGLALEEGVESRLVSEQPDAEPADRWQVRHGPFSEKDFRRMPKTHWTLLVQAVDQLVPEVHELLHRFRFIPNWRLDDIMVSYATDQGGVGPHFDHYDVFLIQAKGTRRWKIGQTCDAQTPIIPGAPQKVIANFVTQDEYLARPGDLLYIPAGVAHWGVAEGDCLTYSIGFRAPSFGEAVLDYSQSVAGYFSDDLRFTGAPASAPGHPGEIRAQDLAALKTFLSSHLFPDELLAEWFGQYMTQPKRDALTFDREQEFPLLSPSSRAVFLDRGNDVAMLFIDGDSFECSRELAARICGYQPIDRETLSEADRAVADILVERDQLI